MDFFQAQEHAKQVFGVEKINVEFDNSCVRDLHFVFTEGLPHLDNHFTFNRVKLSTDDGRSMYVPIAPHRHMESFAKLKNIVGSFNDAFVHPNDLEEIIELQKNQKPEDSASLQSKLKHIAERGGFAEQKVLE